MESDKEQLKRIWVALADFFLDTELDDRDLQRISDVVAQSGFGREDVRRVLLEDLFPALLFNLESVAGEWAGFPDEWLIERIEARRNPDYSERLRCKANFWRIEDYWIQLEAILKDRGVWDC